MSKEDRGITHAKVVALMYYMGDEELEVLHDLAARLYKGQTLYAKLDLQNDQRDMDKEAYEEDLDSAIYRSCGYVKRKNAQAGKKKRTNNRARKGV